MRRIAIAGDSVASGESNRKREPLKTVERTIQRAIVDYLTWKGYCLAVTDRSRRIGRSSVSMPGYPDVSLVVKGRAVFLEIKAPEGKLSEAQVKCHETLRSHGALVFVVRSVDQTIMCLAGL